MGLDKYIESALKGVLKNPIVSLLREIGIASILKQSNFTKRSVGVAPYLILLHFVYMLVIHKNLFFAFVYNSAGVPVAAGVLYPFFGILLSPIIAAAAMSFSSVSVISNSLRLKHMKL